MPKAVQAHSTPASDPHNVVRFPEARPRQPGPVTLAIAAVRAPGASLPFEWEDDLAAGRATLAVMRSCAKARIRQDIALLDSIGWDHTAPASSPAGVR